MASLLLYYYMVILSGSCCLCDLLVCTNNSVVPMQVPLHFEFGDITTHITDSMKLTDRMKGTEDASIRPSKGWRFSDESSIQFQLNLLLIWVLEKYAKTWRLVQNSLWLEFGVGSGYSLNITAVLRKSLNEEGSDFEDKLVFGFDPHGVSDKDNVGSDGVVADGLIPALEKNVKIEKGFFNQTLVPFLQRYPRDIGFVSLNNIDYSNAMEVYKSVLPRLTRHGIIHFHEGLLPFSRGGEGQAQLLAFCAYLQANPNNHFVVIPKRGKVNEAAMAVVKVSHPTKPMCKHFISPSPSILEKLNALRQSGIVMPPDDRLHEILGDLSPPGNDFGPGPPP